MSGAQLQPKLSALPSWLKDQGGTNGGRWRSFHPTCSPKPAYDPLMVSCERDGESGRGRRGLPTRARSSNTKTLGLSLAPCDFRSRTI